MKKVEPIINPQFRIHPDSRIGKVELNVANLERQIAFYEGVLGLKAHWRETDRAGLGAGGEDLLVFYEHPDARRYRTTGIYHFAILVPDRQELARAIRRLFSLEVPNYPTDHVLTKSTYFDDPEGNNIEMYTESPEDGIFGVENGVAFAQRADGSLSDGREPIDLQALFEELDEDESLIRPLPKETRIGHVHLYVANLEHSLRFYHELLGFDNMGLDVQRRMGMVSAGGYHHHIGFNTWIGEGAPPAEPGVLGLRSFSVLLPSEEALSAFKARIQEVGVEAEAVNGGWKVRDPSQIAIVFQRRS